MTEQTNTFKWPDTCDGLEQGAFEAWASGNGYQMDQHQLHYLFLNDETGAARDGWKAGLMYAVSQIKARTPTAGDTVAWAVARWESEVKNRPMQNIHRRTLDDTWRQVIRNFGGDPDTLIGPDHDTLMCEKGNK